MHAELVHVFDAAIAPQLPAMIAGRRVAEVGSCGELLGSATICVLHR